MRRLGEARKIAAMAEADKRPIAPHDCTGPIVLAASVHLALHAPSALFQEVVRAYLSGWYRDLVTVLPTIKDGHVMPFEGAGLGARNCCPADGAHGCGRDDGGAR